LFGGPGILDSLLCTSISELLDNLDRAQLVSNWFFIRYADPQSHLRLRFKLYSPESRVHFEKLLHECVSQCLSSQLVSDVQVDTYHREIERYGGKEGMSVAEDVFTADSIAVLEILKNLEGDNGLELRWKAALIGIDRLFTDLGFDLNMKCSLCTQLRDSYHKEMGFDVRTKQHIGDKFRAQRSDLKSLFDDIQGSTSGEPPFIDRAFRRRSQSIVRAKVRLDELSARGHLFTTLTELAASYAHMHVNRMVRSLGRSYEAVLYDFLVRLYGAQAAVGRSFVNNSVREEAKVAEMG
jgi:thiopeptide-type bacteriocin biosynthesis protein